MKRKNASSTIAALLASALLLLTLSACGGSSRVEEKLTDEQAMSAIRNYCHFSDPTLESIEKAGEYPIYWELASSTDAQIVVLYRSYTGAQLRYYIERTSGKAYVTEYVPGISSAEERTEESFSAKEYLFDREASPDAASAVPGTWQTASVAYEADGTMQSEYFVRFTDKDVVYGHMKDGEFVVGHADMIAALEKTAAGGYRIRAEASNGVQYTYQSAESDGDVLEYYETWREEDFPTTYRGGASLSRCGE